MIHLSTPRRTGVHAVLTAICCVLLLLCTPDLHAQLTSVDPARSTGPRVFLDCQGRMPCDRAHFRTEINFVNWARDREDSDVHVIATSEGVGGGGRRFTLDFIGRGEMADLSDQLTYTSSGSDVTAETLDGLTQALRIGLMRYAVQSGLGQNFDIRFNGTLASARTNGEAATPSAVRDPWNYWTFRVALSGYMNLRETSTNTRVNPSFAADRVTEDWKVGFGGSLNYQREGRQLSDGSEIRNDRDDWSIDVLTVRTVSGHISTGFAFAGLNSVGRNQHARLRFAPAVEYNYFPYLEANRRQFTVLYTAGLEHSNYIEETIYNLMEETRPQHEFQVRYNAREQWGNAGLGMDYAQYLHDSSLYSAGVNGNLSYRITRGLDLNVWGRASWVNDELHIPLTDISDEDILLGRQNLPSSYQYNGSIGLSYRWGSSFTNIVNTRLNTGGRRGGFF